MINTSNKQKNSQDQHDYQYEMLRRVNIVLNFQKKKFKKKFQKFVLNFRWRK